MKAVRRGIGFLLSVMLLFSLTSSYAQTEKIVVWVGNAWTGVYSPEEEGAKNCDFHNEMARLYKENVNSNVEFEIIDIAGTDLWDKITIASQTGDMPDIIFEADFTMFDYAHYGYAVPLNDIIDEDTRADIPESVWESISWNDDIYAYPFTSECGYLAINMALAEKAGATDLLPPEDEYGLIAWTPDQFRAFLEALKPLTEEGVYPFTVYCNGQAGDTWMNMMLRMYGAQFIDEDGTRICYDSPEAIQALNFLGDLYNDGLLTPNPESITSLDSISLFTGSKSVVSIMNNLSIPDIRAGQADGSIEDFDIKYAYFPSVGDPYCFAYIKASWVFDVAQDPDRLAVAKDFVKFYSSQEPYILASNIYCPVRTSMAAILEQTDPVMSMLTKGIANSAVITGKVPAYSSLRPLFYTEEQAFYTGEKTAEEALMDYTTQANELLEKNLTRSILYK